jgi:hypothetical protein
LQKDKPNVVFIESDQIIIVMICMAAGVNGHWTCFSSLGPFGQNHKNRFSAFSKIKLFFVFSATKKSSVKACFPKYTVLKALPQNIFWALVFFEINLLSCNYYFWHGNA